MRTNSHLLHHTVIVLLLCRLGVLPLAPPIGMLDFCCCCCYTHHHHHHQLASSEPFVMYVRQPAAPASLAADGGSILLSERRHGQSYQLCVLSCYGNKTRGTCTLLLSSDTTVNIPLVSKKGSFLRVSINCESLQMHRSSCNYEEEDAGTQTDNASFTTSEVWSATDSAIDESDESGECTADTVMQRISRRLFAQERRRVQDRATQTAKDPLVTETEKLAFDIVFFAVGRRSSKASDETVACLRRSVSKMLDKHSLVFTSMVSRLHLNVTDSSNDLHRGFQELSNELFVQNEVSWSKIIALFAFGARLAQHCEESKCGRLVFDVATNLAMYSVEKLTPFLKQHGGWSTLCEAFPADSDYEAKIWRTLVFTGLGLTAVATFLALQH